MTLATLRGRKAALAALKQRRAHQPTRIDNSALHAGSDMTYYCKSCGHVSDVLPEAHFTRPRALCEECLALKDLGWLE